MAIGFEEVPKEFVTKVSVFDHKKPVTEVMGNIARDGAILVTKDNAYLGIVDDRALARSGLKLSRKAAVGKFAMRLPVIDPSTSINKAILYFYNSRSKAIPYSEKEKPTGVIMREAILKAMLSLHLVSKYPVKEMMSTPVIAIDANASVSQARSEMQQNRINKLVVLMDGKVFGMLSNKDILLSSAMLEKRAPPGKLPGSSKVSMARVSEVCERDVKSVSHNMTADDAIRAMIEHNVSSLLVKRDGKPVGLLTISDIMEAFLAGEKVFENNIYVSGLDEYTKDYEDDILSSLDGIADKMNKFGRFKVNYITLNVKRQKSRNYELRGKVGLEKRGNIWISSQGYTLDSALKDLESKAYKLVKQKKELIVTGKRERKRVEESD